MLESLFNKIYEKETSTQAFSCEYGETLKAPVLKNIWERLLLIGGTDKEIYSIYLRKNYYKYCWYMKQFLNVIKVYYKLLVYNPNYSSGFLPDWYLENVVFGLMFKWDMETYQM